MKFTKLCILASLMFIACLSLKATDQTTDTPNDHHKAALDQLYSLRMGNGWGFVDGNNKIAIPAFFDDAEDFSEGLGQVMIAGKWGFVNRSGNIVIPPFYDNSEPFTDGLAAVCKEDKWGYIDSNGKIKIDFLYRMAGNFYENLALVSETGEKDSFGFINKSAKYVIPTGIYDDAKFFSEGLAPVEDNEKWGYINKEGKIAIPLAYEEAQIFSSGYAAVRSNGKWGYINKEGKAVTKFDYDYASNFTSNGAIVSENGRSFILGPDKLFLPIAAANGGADWMAAVTDPKSCYLLDLSIPGTHDSGTYDAKSSAYRCQEKSVRQQLEMGVRFLDIRVGDAGKGQMHIWHGGKDGDCHINLKSFVDDIITFLKLHPKEAVICCFKVEYQPSKGSNVVLGIENILFSENNKNYIYTCDDQKPPTLEKVKGKIIYMHRYDSNRGGIWVSGWKENTTFRSHSIFGIDTLLCEDYYNPNVAPTFEESQRLKRKTIIDWTNYIQQNYLSKKKSIDSPSTGNIYLTFVSAYWGIPDIPRYAKHMNPWACEYIPMIKNPFIGIWVFDYIDENIANIIWSKNFSK